MKKKIVGILICGVVILGIVGCKSKKVNISVLNDLREQITLKISEQNDYDNFASCGVDEENGVVVVELVDNSKKERDWFKKNIVNSKYIKFTQGGPYTTSKGKDSRGLYLINDTFSIYSDEENPMFIEYSGKTSIKEFLPQSNCLPGCIHNDSEPIDTLNDGGTKIYEYQVENDKYYFIECHKIGSKYNNGKDILIGKDKEKLINLTRCAS